MMNILCTALMIDHIVQWQTDLNISIGVNDTNRNKLRTNGLFNGSYETELIINSSRRVS
jgi:hypothetical protein